MHALDPVHFVMKDSVTQSHTEPSLCSAQHRLWWRGRGDCKPSFCLPQLWVGQRPTQPSAQIRTAIKLFYFTPAGSDPWGVHRSGIRACIELQTFPIKPLSDSFPAKRCLLLLSDISPTHLKPVRKAGRAGHTKLKRLPVARLALLSFRVTLSDSSLWPKIWPDDLLSKKYFQAACFFRPASLAPCAHRNKLLWCLHTVPCHSSSPFCP